MVPKAFQEWACSLSGCDGGNIDADIWLCGIEWGGGSYDDGIYYKERLARQISSGAVNLSQQTYDWKDSITYPFGRSVAKLFAAIKGSSVGEYRDLAINRWNGNEIFKLNLYPIAFDSTDPSLWHKYGLEEITGFDEKHLFQLWCFMNRFPAFSKLRSEKKPKLIIGTGVSYLRDFLMCFGGVASSKIHYAELEPISERNAGNRRFYWVSLDEYTTLVVIPFFSGPRGLNSDILLEKMGAKIREFLT